MEALDRKGNVYMKFTCIECGDKYEQILGDPDERMCDDCVDFAGEKEYSVTITASYGALDPEVLSIFGRWLGKAGSWTVEQFKSIPVAEILEFLSRADRAKLEGMGIDPDATPVGFGESSMRTGDKPAVEDAIAMMFNMPQRV